jgi:PKD repeat protein
LSEGRFQIQVEWEALNIGRKGQGVAVPLTADAGYFWFFSANNIELVIKAVDGRSVNNNFWVFYGALTNVQYVITAIDTETGAVQKYSNPQNNQVGVADTSAFGADFSGGPEAHFSFLPGSPLAGAPTQFQDTSTGDPISWAWDFGDGTPIVLDRNPVHTFSAGGEYSVTLAIRNAESSAAVTEDVHVTGAGPETGASAVDFLWSPSLPASGQPVTLTATFTGTPVAGSSVRWSFPGGVHLTGNPVTFTFPTAESEIVEVELEQPGRATIANSHVVTVASGGPVAGATAVNFGWSPPLPSTGEVVTFTASFTGTPPPGSVVRWSFPGGVHLTGNPVNFTFSKTEPESVDVELQQTGHASLFASHVVSVGSSGGSSSATAVDFGWSPSTPTVSQSTAFTATFTGTPSPGFVVKWSFPGGVHLTGNPVNFTFSKAEPETVDVELQQSGQASLFASHVVSVGG